RRRCPTRLPATPGEARCRGVPVEADGACGQCVAGGGWRVAPTAAALSRSGTRAAPTAAALSRSGRRVAPTAATLSRSGRPFAEGPCGNVARNDSTAGEARVARAWLGATCGGRGSTIRGSRRGFFGGASGVESLRQALRGPPL